MGDIDRNMYLADVTISFLEKGKFRRKRRDGGFSKEDEVVNKVIRDVIIVGNDPGRLAENKMFGLKVSKLFNIEAPWFRVVKIDIKSELGKSVDPLL